MFAARWMRPLGLSLLALFLSVIPLVAQADIPAPGPRPRPRPIEPAPKTEGAPLEVVVEDGGRGPQLEIPRGLLPKEAAEKPAGLFGGFEGVRTVVAGLALSLAVVVGGLWLVRKFGAAGSKPLPKAATAVMVVTLLVCGLAVATAWADLLPPGGGARPPRPRPPIAAGLTLNVVVVEKGDKITLRVSAADLAKMAGGGKVRFGTGAIPGGAAPRSAPPEK